MSAQLSQHGRVGIGGGHRDLAAGERSGRLAGAGPDLECGPDRSRGVVQDHVDDRIRVGGPELLVGRSYRPKGQPPLRHLTMFSWRTRRS